MRCQGTGRWGLPEVCCPDRKNTVTDKALY
uniref:Uncharacterized protein n=1 Tax=Siphoviridae sp. ctL7J9 TaxID=2827845 RepID=A0A8S5T625_9CAUD|nr:MAG TPA: hypothetical protein [Siphoviridae sp. ctL7J9]